MVAQALVAAALTVTDGKTMHSMHSYFMRPVDIGAEVRYEVEVLRDGRGYSTRQVRGFQNGKPVYVCLAELRRRRAERHASRPRPPADVPGPGRRCRRSADYLDGPHRRHDDRGVEGLLVRRPQLRHAPRPRAGLPHRRGRAVAPPGGLGQAVRRAASGRRAHRRAARPAALAYVCDYTILEPVLRVLGLAVGRRGPGHREPRPRHVVPPRRWRWTTGCSTRRRRSPSRPAAARPSAASSPRTARTSRPSSRRA